MTAALVALRPSLGLATEALIYLLLVFLTAVWWGRGPSLTAGLLSFLALNFFFTEPYHTLAVASPEDVVSLLVFLVVAEMAARLATQLRTREAEARGRAQEASTLYALTHDLSAPTWAETLPRVAARLVEVVGVREATIFLADGSGRLALQAAAPGDRGAARASDPAPEPARRAFASGQPVEEGPLLALPLAVGDRVLGVLQVNSPPGGRHPLHPVLRTLAEHLAVLIERLRLRQEAEEAEALRKTDELKSALLAAVSHELRTPLSSIRIAATGLLQEDARADAGVRRELLNMIDAEASRLARLVNNLLDLSRIEGGVLHPVREWRDLHEVTARAVDGLHDRLQQHRMIVALPADLPLVPLDFTQIEDVLVNLLDNSVRHSPEGTTIRVSAVPRGPEVVVQVENEGPPIPVAAADQIFTRFYRGQHDRRGLGLGLAICKGLIEAHGGRIWVERPGDPGARFAFTLPLAEAPPPARPPATAAEAEEH